jgi:hypothetical protein
MIIFVLGMHRSGTSMVTGILHICGAWLGKKLLMGAKDNPKGHFENKHFLNINQKILRANGGRWDKPPNKVEFAGCKSAMKRFLLSLPNDKIVVLKDPRTALTFPLWRQLIPLENMKIIYIQRNHEAVAKSLQARNGFKIEHDLYLSRYYNNEIKKHLIPMPLNRMLSCHYANFFTNYQEFIVEQLVNFSALPEINQETWDKINRFITPGLRHWK